MLVNKYLNERVNKIETERKKRKRSKKYKKTNKQNGATKEE